MKVALIARSTLYKLPGGITVHVMETAKHLRQLGIEADVLLANEKISYEKFDLLHFFDVIRPANILYHIKKSGKPYVITPVLIDYSEYDKQFRKGFTGMIFRMFPAHRNEYIKTVSRWLLGKDSLQSKSYLWKGQNSSILTVLKKAAMIMPNSQKEYEKLAELYPVNTRYVVIPNGIDEQLFIPDSSVKKEEYLVLCAARIEGLKNQLTLIRALNNTKYQLVLAGDIAVNQKSYYRLCKKNAADNIRFVGKVSQEKLLEYYKRAKVHILPSWFETCGLSSMEAAAMGCNIVITNKGFSREYFGEDAFYCDPANETSVFEAVAKAAESPLQKRLQEKILNAYTWKQSSIKTLDVYKNILS